MIRVPERLQHLLREVLVGYHPELLARFSSAGELSLGRQEREALRVSLTSELCQSGLLPDDEPNERGLALEDLIDLVGDA